MSLLDNVVNNYQFLVAEFTGISINITGVFQFILQIILTIGLFVTFYLLGDKLRRIFFNNISVYIHFINIALGYIFTGTLIGVLGTLSLLHTGIVVVFLLIIVTIAIYPPLPFNFKRKNIKALTINIKSGSVLRKNIVVFAAFIFVLISFLRLMTPEIAEDGYHTDLPRLYLSWHTTLHESKEMLRVIPYPQLPEMIYLISIFLGQLEATRFIHFGFYLLIVLLLLKIGKNHSIAKYSALLFVTAPLVIRYSPSQHTDFFAVFCFLLAVLTITSKVSNKSIILSGILFGAVISTKIWMLVYLPAFVLYIIYISKTYNLSAITKMAAIFFSSTLLVSALWHMRAFLITGNPLFPIFSKWTLLGEAEPVAGSLSSFIGFNIKMFSYENLIVYSPLFFLGIIFVLFNMKKFFVIVRKFPIAVFVIFIFVEQLLIQVYLGRYLVTFYTLSTLIVSAAIVLIIKNKYYTYAFSCLYITIFIYYFINTLLILPYGFGWADKDKYLTRVLGRDNVSYYDFDGLFSKWITKDDLVATYGIGSFYYADFSYIDMGFIFDEDTKNFDQLEKMGITKILIKGGDMEWFSEKVSLTGYDKSKLKLLATYPADTKKYNLYSIEK